MDIARDPSVMKEVVMKAAQVGYTEGVLGNTIGFYIDQDPSSMLVIQPNLEMAASWSKERLAPMIRDTKVLADKVRDPKNSRDPDNTVRVKVFPGGRLAIMGANSAAGLASRPIRIVIGDEIDKWKVSAGTEGDPLKLAGKRQTTFWNRKTIIGSTPNVEATSIVFREYLASDQRKYLVPCPQCGHEQVMSWKNVRWDKTLPGEPPDDVYGNHKPWTAHYVCEGSGCVWNDNDRNDAVKRGRWEATRVSRTVGYHITGFLSPWLTFQGIVEEFLEARHDQELLIVWTNSVLGEPFKGMVERADAKDLSSRGESYTPDTLPLGVRILSAGLDTQADRLEVQVIGWGDKQESWVVDYQIFYGDPAQEKVWNEVDRYLLRPFHREDGTEMRISACCCDTGGHHAQQVYAFCRKRRMRRVFATKGTPGPKPIWPKRPSRSKWNEQVFLLGVDTAKDAIYGRTRIENPGPGYIHFPQDTVFDEAYFGQLTSEQVVTRYKMGRPYRVWEQKRKGIRNEVLDTFVYALAARLAVGTIQEVGRQGVMDEPPPKSVARPSIAHLLARANE